MTTRNKTTKTVQPQCSGVSSYVELCLERLREEGGRISGARLRLINILAKAERPLVPKEILERSQAGAAASPLDLASVYRNLEALEVKGLIHQIGHSGGYFPCMHSDCGANVHVLTYCESCKRTQEIHVSNALNRILKELVAENSKAMSRVSKFQVDGLCGKCVKSS